MRKWLACPPAFLFDRFGESIDDDGLIVTIYSDFEDPWAGGLSIGVDRPGEKQSAAAGSVLIGAGFPDSVRDWDHILATSDYRTDLIFGPVITREEGLEILKKSPEGSTEDIVNGLLRIGKSRVSSDVELVRRSYESEDPIVRYSTIGVLTWYPTVTNEDLGEVGADDPDPRVSELADRLLSGKQHRFTSMN